MQHPNFHRSSQDGKDATEDSTHLPASRDGGGEEEEEERVDKRGFKDIPRIR